MLGNLYFLYDFLIYGFYVFLDNDRLLIPEIKFLLFINYDLSLFYVFKRFLNDGDFY
jgi:hypothetical protein